MTQKTILSTDQANYDKRSWTRIINCLSGFKSTGLVGTDSSDQVGNLSVVSSLFHVGANPPLMGFVLRPHSSKSPRHTLINIREQSCFTINHITEDFYKKAHQASARHPYEVCEFKKCQLQKVYKQNFKAPFVGEAKIQIGLKLAEEIHVKSNNTHIVIGEINQIHIPEHIIQSDGFLNIDQAGTLTVSGLDTYNKAQKIARLSYAKPDLPVTEI